MTDADGPDDRSGSLSDTLSRLNTLSLLVQAGVALRRGDGRRAALLFGAAALAPRHRGLSYAIQGALAVGDLREKLAGTGSGGFDDADAIEIPIDVE